MDRLALPRLTSGYASHPTRAARGSHPRIGGDAPEWTFRRGKRSRHGEESQNLVHDPGTLVRLEKKLSVRGAIHND